jgi:hypothetical protein
MLFDMARLVNQIFFWAHPKEEKLKCFVPKKKWFPLNQWCKRLPTSCTWIIDEPAKV